MRTPGSIRLREQPQTVYSMNFAQTLRFLNQKGNEVTGIHLGLQRITTLMNALGRPQLNYPAVHIAGTNGKGSVAAMAESILRSAGLKTGLYTSPHLVRLSERIRVGGQEISGRHLARAATRIRKTEASLLKRGALDRPVTYFEFLTACAFLYFAEAEVDIGVIEVGLGGLHDATNVVRPAACVITGISLDHENLLGSTIEAIAREKAGIIKPKTPVISGCRAPSARRVVCERARELDAPLMEIDRAHSSRTVAHTGGRFTIDLETPCGSYRRLRLALSGEHQVRNAVLAVTAVEALNVPCINPAAVKVGLAHTVWPGRLDLYPGERTTLLDGAHNPEGAELLRRHLARFWPGEIHLVFGAMRDKDIQAIGRRLFPIASTIHLTPLKNPRSALPRDMAAEHRRYANVIRIHSNSREALRAAWRECSRKGMVVVTGSLYLIGEILPLLRK